MELAWDKPVVVFYRERTDKPERTAFLAIKSRKLIVIKDEDRIKGSIVDFFPLMGDIDYVSSKEGTSDSYVICWFDDEEEDLRKSWRRLTGVTFREGVSFSVDTMKKKTYNADFTAKKGKLK